MHTHIDIDTYTYTLYDTTYRIIKWMDFEINLSLVWDFI